MANLEAKEVKVKTTSPQMAFGIQENRFLINQLESVLGSLGDGKKILDQVLGRKIWQEAPAGEKAVVDLLDNNNRRIHFMDDIGSLYGSKPFDPKEEIKGLSLALVMIPALNDLNQPVIKSDLKAIAAKLAKGKGGLIVLEKVSGEAGSNGKERQAFLPAEETDLIKPQVLAPHHGVRLWETRRAKEGDKSDFAAVMAYNRVLNDLADKVGIHQFEDLNGSLILVDWSRHGVSTTKIGGEPMQDYDQWQQLAVKNGIKLPQLTEKQRKLRFALIIKEREKEAERQQFLITEDMFITGVKLARFCKSGDHDGAPQPLIASLRKEKEKHGHLKRILVDISCPNHGDLREPVQHLDVKAHTRTVKGVVKKGWILTGRVGNGVKG